MKMKVYSVDAWREELGWSCNNRFECGIVDVVKPTARRICKALRDAGMLTMKSAGKVEVDKSLSFDGIYTVCARNGEPLFDCEEV
jgi:hypothetical protein